MPGKRKTPQDYYNLAKKLNWVWKGIEIPKRTTISTEWECPEGHCFQRSYSNARGPTCPVCDRIFRRHSEDDYYALAHAKNFEYLGPFPTSALKKTHWRCVYGHIWQSRYNDIQQDKGCPYCSNHVPKNVDDYHQLAENNDLMYLGPFPRTTQDKAWWKCSMGHKFETAYSSIQQGHGCHFCPLPWTGKEEKHYHALADEKGLSFLGPYRNGLKVRNKVQWQCSNAHIFEASFREILKRVICCPICRQKNEEDYHNRARKLGHAWIGSSLPQTGMNETRWRCVNGHEWETTYAALGGCMECWTSTYKDDEDYFILGRSVGLRWIGPRIGNVTYKTLWECTMGHRFLQSYTGITTRKEFCPTCYRERCAERMKKRWRKGDFDGVFQSPTKPELATAAALDVMEIEHVAQYRPDGYSRPFDEFIPPNTLIEVQGSYWHGPEKSETQQRDKEKAQWAKENGFNLVILWEHEINECGAKTLLMERLPLSCISVS